MMSSKREFSCFISAICPICGKEFFPTEGWVYNSGNYTNGKYQRVCSYKCHREARDKINKSKKLTHRQEKELQTREMVRKKLDGVPLDKIAKEFGLTLRGTSARINCYIRNFGKNI